MKRDHKRSNESKSTKRKIIAPFELLKVEKIYWVWGVSFLISFASIIVDFLNSELPSAFEQGAFYATCLAVIAPYFLDFIVDYCQLSKMGKKENFSTYKSWTFVLSIGCVFFLIVFYITKCRTNSVLQVISTLIVAAVSFYTYLVYKMEAHPILMKQYEDIPYAVAENKSVNDLSRSAQKAKKYETESGEEVKL